MHSLATISNIDEKAFLWINRWAGNTPLIDGLVERLASDYLVPVTFSLTLLGLWFGWRGQAMRKRHQFGVLVSGLGIGIANILVKTSNSLYFRPRPFDTYEVNLLFYPPTDSSFPANPIAVTIAMASGAWLANKKIGLAMYAIVVAYGFSRIYAGVFYPGDVAGGLLFGITAAYVSNLSLKKLAAVRRKLLKLARFVILA